MVPVGCHREKELVIDRTIWDLCVGIEAVTVEAPMWR